VKAEKDMMFGRTL